MPSPVWSLPICLDSWPNIPGSYAILLFTASDLASITSHTQTWVLFLLWLRLFILSGVISPQSPVTYWEPTDLGSSSFSILSFCLFILFMEFSRHECWSGFPFPSLSHQGNPFPSLVDHILSKLSTMTHLSWISLHSMAHSFIELDKTVVHVISLVSFLWLWFSFCLPSDG